MHLLATATAAQWTAPVSVSSAGAYGNAATLAVDLQSLPAASGTWSAGSGSSMFFQAWMRDQDQLGHPTSNSTDVVRTSFW